MASTIIAPDGRMRYDGLETRLASAMDANQTQIFFEQVLTHSGGEEVIDVPVNQGGSDYIPLALLDQNNRLAEIVHLIGYGRAQVSGVVRRGQEGTNSRQHPQGVKIVHASTVQDYLNVQAHVDDPQAHKQVIGGLANSIMQGHLTAHESNPAADPHPIYVRRDNATLTTVEVTDTLVIRPNAQLVIQGDLVVEGRILINGYEIHVGPTPPPTQPDNLVWIQTVS